MSRWVGCEAMERSEWRAALSCQLWPSGWERRETAIKRGHGLRGKVSNFKILSHPHELINRTGLRWCLHNLKKGKIACQIWEDVIISFITHRTFRWKHFFFLSFGYHHFSECRNGAVMPEAQCPWQHCHANSNHVSCISTKQPSPSGGCSQQLTTNKHLSVLDAQWEMPVERVRLAKRGWLR